MSGASHTAGPWERLEGFAEPGHPIYKPGTRVIRIVQKRAPGQTEFVKLALVDSANAWDDATLIAAAPDSVAANREALDFIVSYFGPVASDDPQGWSDDEARTVAEQLRAALRKATGAE